MGKRADGGLVPPTSVYACQLQKSERYANHSKKDKDGADYLDVSRFREIGTSAEHSRPEADD